MNIHQKNQLNQSLINWYSKAYRKLPWRAEPSLYKTVVSEFMLQQTQVKTVLPYFEKWLKMFPDFHSLAKASDESVLKHWEGLGYYSRARNLHKLAKVISIPITLEEKGIYAQQFKNSARRASGEAEERTHVRDEGFSPEAQQRGNLKCDAYILPSIPTTPEEWQKLPGVGPYTAAAICSIAFAHPIAVVDGNVIRILSRLFAYDNPLKNNSEAVKIFTPLATQLLNKKDPNTHNQAMMELGATLCLKHNPLCTICPFVNFCKAAAKGIQSSLPRLMRKKTTRLTIDRLWIVKKGHLLLEQIPNNAARLANLYELPVSIECFELAKLSPIHTLKRAISNQSIQENLYSISLSAKINKIIHAQPNWQWIAIDQLHRIALSGPHRKWIEVLLSQKLSNITTN